jgi:hypothetical protein
MRWDAALVSKARFGLALVGALSRAGRDGPDRRWVGADPRARNAGFLALVEQEILGRARRPYRALLDCANWDRNRLRRSLTDEGLEGTLERLADDGVFLEAEEIKGRKPLVRGGREIPFTPLDLEFVNGPTVPLGTSGTSGPRTKNPVDLDGLRLQASTKVPMLDALGAIDLPLVLYYPALSAAGIGHMISFALAGVPPRAWFCHLPESASPQRTWGLWLRALVGAARLRGVRLPLPRLAPVTQPKPLVDWLRREAIAGAVVATFPGSALRLQESADAAGVDLPPITWLLGGEPVSPRKLERLTGRGHRVYPWYGAVDTGRIAIGCLDPCASDDMHLLTDRFAAITRDPGGGRSDPGRLFLTGLVPGMHKLLLNVDCGDHVRLEKRRCGCPLERLGLDWHVHHVRSTQKLTLDGITLPADVVRDLAEERLPAACGGSPADYQILEEEDEDGLTRLVVRVEPTLDAEDAAIARATQDVLSTAAGGAGDLARRLRAGGVVSVRRERPEFSRGGKLLGLMPREKPLP